LAFNLGLRPSKSCGSSSTIKIFLLICAPHYRSCLQSPESAVFDPDTGIL
jgi:hypothetical protein